MIPSALQLTLLDNQSTGLILLDQQGLVRYLNPSAENLLSCGAKHAQGKRLPELIDSHTMTEQVINEALHNNTSIALREITWTLHNQHQVTLDFSLSPMHSERNEGLLCELWPLDRKLRISGEEQRIAIQDAAQSMLRGLAHEVKNPLGGIRGAAQLLARQTPEASEYTDVIVAEADRLRELVDRLNAPFKYSPAQALNIHEVLERVALLIQAECGDSIKLVRDYDPSIPDIPGHEDLLIQAVLNLARNSVQALLESEQHGGTLTLRSRVATRFTLHHQQHSLVCKITVEDNGPGIPEEIRESMFLPLVSGRAQGTGLGLSITQSVIHQHAGLVECSSRPQRTQFDIYLPLQNNNKHPTETPHGQLTAQ